MDNRSGQNIGNIDVHNIPKNRLIQRYNKAKSVGDSDSTRGFLENFNCPDFLNGGNFR